MKKLKLTKEWIDGVEKYAAGDLLEVDETTFSELVEGGYGQEMVKSVSRLPKEEPTEPTTDLLTQSREKAIRDAVRDALKDLPKDEPMPKIQITLDEGDRVFKSLGEMCHAVIRDTQGKGPTDKRLERLKATGMSEGVPSEGGFLVEPTIAAGILTNVFTTGIFLARTKRIAVGANSNRLVVNAIAETSRVHGSRFGGVRAYWGAEGGTKTASRPTFRQMEIPLCKLTGITVLTDELLADATALTSVLTMAFEDEFRFMGDDGILRGTGAGMPLGILNSPALVTVTRAGAGHVTAADVIGMYARLMSQSLGAAAWFINQDVIPEIVRLNFVGDTAVTDIPVFLPAGTGWSTAPWNTLLGLPIIASEHCSTLGTTGDIVLADLSRYMVVTKGTVETATSIHVYFVTDETALRFVLRIGGQPDLASAVTPYQGTNTISPFVVLS